MVKDDISIHLERPTGFPISIINLFLTSLLWFHRGNKACDKKVSLTPLASSEKKKKLLPTAFFIRWWCVVAESLVLYVSGICQTGLNITSKIKIVQFDPNEDKQR